MKKIKNCSLCEKPGGKIIFEDSFCRIIIPDENIFGLQRIIWNQHVKEISELNQEELNHLFKKVCFVENSIKKTFSPNKINIASLGNHVPHLHLHIIPRWKTDPWWPNSIWQNLPSIKWKKINSSSDIFLTISSWEKTKFLVNKLRKKISFVEVKNDNKQIFDDFDKISRHAVLKIKDKIIGSGRLNQKGEIDNIFFLDEYKKDKFINIIKNCLIEECQRLKI